MKNPIGAVHGNFGFDQRRLGRSMRWSRGGSCSPRLRHLGNFLEWRRWNIGWRRCKRRIRRSVWYWGIRDCSVETYPDDLVVVRWWNKKWKKEYLVTKFVVTIAVGYISNWAFQFPEVSQPGQPLKTTENPKTWRLRNPCPFFRKPHGRIRWKNLRNLQKPVKPWNYYHLEYMYS